MSQEFCFKDPLGLGAFEQHVLVYKSCWDRCFIVKSMSRVIYWSSAALQKHRMQVADDVFWDYGSSIVSMLSVEGSTIFFKAELN